MQTPDPIRTTEQAVAFATQVVAVVVVTLGLDVPDTWKAAAVVVIAVAYAGFTLYHAAHVRSARAAALSRPS